ncbi:thiol:disulfide interchange protein, thioredoxin family [Caldimonas brevitalea]|uniref:Thiol:disulfide interchange protein, thioredoxin family n=1 Tax=Caldimonas brevitalea TaxID=413882 RepID=A0A0G3BI39_9BURK|nr:thiol:disulfide interchange protein, thioredoxin family [Caldimonas brevitalea]
MSAAWLGTAAWRPATAQPGPVVGAPLVLPQLPLLGGGRYGEAQASGRVLVLYWWATWCPFCALQTPRIDALWREHRERGLELLTIAVDKRESTVREYLAAKGYRFPVVLDHPALASALPRPKGLPVTLLRGRDGRIAVAEAGEMFPEDIAGFAKFL